MTGPGLKTGNPIGSRDATMRVPMPTAIAMMDSTSCVSPTIFILSTALFLRSLNLSEENNTFNYQK